MPVALDLDTTYGPARADLHEVDGSRALLVLGHGAGGGVGARDLVETTRIAASEAIAVALVEQPYRVAGRRSPAPAAQLDVAWLEVVAALRTRVAGVPLLVGGRSSGARVACRTVTHTGASGVVCLAFPLQPAQGSRPEPRPSRLGELDLVPVDVIVVQGATDPFGVPPSSPSRTVVVVEGDHSLRRGLGEAEEVLRAWLRLHSRRTR